MNKTGIEYLTHTWNPIAMRCTRISPACDRCWHLTMANRMAKNPKLSQGVRDAHAGKREPVLVESRLDEPMRRRKRAVIGVQFMGDLFHDAVPYEWIDRIFEVITNAPQHTFQILTKRPERMAEYMPVMSSRLRQGVEGRCVNTPDVLQNLGLGVTAENQEMADKRIPLLLQIPAAVRFVSAEPLLSNITMPSNRPNFSWFVDRAIHQVIVGAETGPGARPMDLEWARNIRDQCAQAGVAFFFERDSHGRKTLGGVEWHQFPEVKDV